MNRTIRLAALATLMLIQLTEIVAEVKISLERRDARTVAVVLINSEPVAAVQLTVLANASLTISSAAGSVGSEWLFASNLLLPRELRIVVLGKTRCEFPAGSTEITRLTIDPSDPLSEEFQLEATQVVASTNEGTGLEAVGSKLSWTGAFDREAAVGFTLAGNFPNPFNPSTTITYSLERFADVRLAVYDMLGREIAVLVNGPKSSGTHQATWSIERGSTSTGMYFARLVVGDRSQVARMVVAQ